MRATVVGTWLVLGLVLTACGGDKRQISIDSMERYKGQQQGQPQSPPQPAR